MSAPRVTAWHLVGVALLVAGVLGAFWFSLRIGGRK